MSSMPPQRVPKKFYHKKTFKVLFQISLTLILFFAEAFTGYKTNCMALISDAFHTLSDLISLCIGLAAIRVGKKTVSAYSRKTFGYKRAEVLGGIVQAVFLLSLCFNIYIEALKRFITPEKQRDVLQILVVGGIGLAVNLLGLCLFSGEHGHSHEGNMNTRGIYLHIMGDTLGSVAVMASAGCLFFFQVPMTQPVPEGEWVPTTDFDEYCMPVANSTSQNLENTNCLILPDYSTF